MAAPANAPRRPLLAALGIGALAALSYALGLREGRRTGDPVIANPAARDDLAFVERFHAASSTTRAGALLRLPGGNWGTAPPPFKPAAGEPIVLPAPQQSPIAPRGRADAAALGTVLWHTAGISARRGGIVLRTAPSSGALFSTELYLAVRAADGLAPGWWHYDALHHALRRVSTSSTPSPGDDALGAPGEALLRDAPIAVLATAVFARTGHKYLDRTYRYLLADLGHALENLRVAAEAVGLAAAMLPRFDDAPAVAALGLDDAQEGMLAIVALRRPGDVVTASTASTRWHPAPPIEAAAHALGITGAMHRASSLRIGGPAVDERQPAAPALDAAAAQPKAPQGVALPQAAAAATPRNTLGVIAGRRSRRRFASTPLPLPALAAVLQAMHGAPPQLSRAVRIQLVAHAVDGLPPGAWRFDAATRTLEPRGPRALRREASRAAALDQDVIGDAAAVFVLSVDRAAIAADPLGAARAYRHAMLEAGLVGERIYLEAGARGLGVCAVGAFYDDEAAALVGVDPAREWIVHFAALGMPQA